MVEERLNPKECLFLVKSFFKMAFPKFLLTKEGTYTGYWWIEYKLEEENIIIYFDGDIGGHFSIKIYINNEEYSLWQFDKCATEKTLSNRQNILWQLEVLKKFLQEEKPNTSLPFSSK